MSITRRRLLTAVATLASASFASHAQVKLDEKDPQAVALGYVDDAGRIDGKKYPKYVAGQACISCSLYQGKAGDAAGACALFQGKLVAAKGWCSAWNKKG